MEDPYWQSFMEQAVRLIYFLAESPDQLCSRLLQRSARLLLDQIAEGGEGNREPDQVQEGSQETNEQGEQGECFIIIYFYYYLNHDNLKVDIYFFFPLFASVSQLRVSGPALGAVRQRGLLAGVPPGAQREHRAAQEKRGVWGEEGERKRAVQQSQGREHSTSVPC